MIVVDIAILVAGITVIGLLSAPRVRAGTANPNLLAAAIAGLMAAAPPLFALTGVVKWDAWFVALASLLLFVLGFFGSRRRAVALLTLDEEKE